MFSLLNDGLGIAIYAFLLFFYGGTTIKIYMSIVNTVSTVFIHTTQEKKTDGKNCFNQTKKLNKVVWKVEDDYNY